MFKDLAWGSIGRTTIAPYLQERRTEFWNTQICTPSRSFTRRPGEGKAPP